LIRKIIDPHAKIVEKVVTLLTKGDEKSLEQLKAMEAQLAALNSQLFELNRRKLEMLEFEK